MKGKFKSYTVALLLAAPLFFLTSCKGKSAEAPLVPSVENIAGKWIMVYYETIKADEVVQLNFKERTYFYNNTKTNKRFQGAMEDATKHPNKWKDEGEESTENRWRYSYTPDADRTASFLRDGSFISFGDAESITRYKVEGNKITLIEIEGQKEEEIGSFSIKRFTADTMELSDHQKAIDEATKQEFTITTAYRLIRVK